MLRYVCEKCLYSFLSPKLDKFRRCDKCDGHLIHVGKPERKAGEYPPIETLNELKAKYVKLREKALRIGLLYSETLVVGRAVRKLSFKVRKRLLKKAGLWQEGVIYKHVMSEGGLIQMVIDKKRPPTSS